MNKGTMDSNCRLSSFQLSPGTPGVFSRIHFIVGIRNQVTQTIR